MTVAKARRQKPPQPVEIEPSDYDRQPPDNVIVAHIAGFVIARVESCDHPLPSADELIEEVKARFAGVDAGSLLDGFAMAIGVYAARFRKHTAVIQAAGDRLHEAHNAAAT